MSLLKYIIIFTSRPTKIHVCACKDQSPPKQCHEMEGKECRSHKACGEGGFCMPVGFILP